MIQSMSETSTVLPVSVEVIISEAGQVPMDVGECLEHMMVEI